MIQKFSTPLGVCLIILLGVLIYANSLTAAFQFDDLDYIIKNESIKDGVDPVRVWRSPWSKGRFLVFLSFAANYQIGGLDPFGYHAVNVILHILTAMAVWWFATLLGGAGPRQKNFPLFIALLFLCHPIQTQAVSYISQRFTLMVTLFYVLSLCLYIVARRGGPLCPPTKGRPQGVAPTYLLFATSGVSALAAMFSKEIAITLPVMVITYEIYFGREIRDPKDEGRGTRDEKSATARGSSIVHRPSSLGTLILVMFLLIIPAIYRFNVINILSIEHLSGSHEGDRLTSWTYFLTQSRVIMKYLGLLLFPAGQNILHDVPMSRSLIDPPATLLSFLVLGALLGLAVKLRRKNPLASFGILWFFLCLSVESSFITIRHVMFEHRLYLPSIGIFLAVSSVLADVGAGPRAGPKSGDHRGSPLRGIVIIIFIFVLSILTIQRNAVWRTPVTLWSDAHAKSPRLIKPLAHLGMAYLHAKEYGTSLAYFNKALKLDPRHPHIFYNRAITHQAMGYWQKALEDYTASLSIDPGNTQAYYNRGNIRARQRQYREAIEDYSAVLARDPDHKAALNNRGIAYLQIDRPKEALADFNRILEKDPGFTKARLNRDRALRQLEMRDISTFQD